MHDTINFVTRPCYMVGNRKFVPYIKFLIYGIDFTFYSGYLCHNLYIYMVYMYRYNTQNKKNDAQDVFCFDNLDCAQK